MSSVPFYPTADKGSESLKNMTRSRSEASPTASRGEPRCNDALVSTGVQNCAKCTHWEAPTASIHGHGDASVFHPNDADRRGAPVLWDTCFYESV